MLHGIVGFLVDVICCRFQMGVYRHLKVSQWPVLMTVNLMVTRQHDGSKKTIYIYIYLFQEAPLNEQVNSETPVHTENYTQWEFLQLSWSPLAVHHLGLTHKTAMSCWQHVYKFFIVPEYVQKCGCMNFVHLHVKDWLSVTFTGKRSQEDWTAG